MLQIKPKLGLIEILVPDRCFLQNPKTFLCADCAALLDINQKHRPDRANKYLDDIYAAGSYDNKYLKRLISAFKYEPFLKSLGTPLADLIADHFLLSQTAPDRNAIVVPVPLARKRLRWRGYNQAQIIAQKLGARWQIPVCLDVLSRIRETENQAWLSGNERRENIKAAFACPSPSEIKNKTIYLVDDVVTTGATMDECAKILKKMAPFKLLAWLLPAPNNKIMDLGRTLPLFSPHDYNRRFVIETYHRWQGMAGS